MKTKSKLLPPQEEFPSINILSLQQRRYWNIVAASEEFINAKTKREQIGIVHDKLCSDKKTGFTQEIAASLFEMSRSAFKKHVDKYQNGVKKSGKPKILNEGQISELAKWLEEHTSVEDWPTYSDISDFCFEKFNVHIMRNTIVKFMKREFKQYKFVKAKPMDSKRLMAPVDSIDSYYKELEDAIKDVDYRFCFNLDETGQDEKTDTHEIEVCVPVEVDPDLVMIPLERCSKRFSILHTISTDGTYFKPFIIVPRKTLEGDIYTIYDKEDISRIRYQEHGFMTEALFMEFMVNFFLPELQRKRDMFNYRGKALLIMDNLIAHTNVINKLELNSYPNKLNLQVKWIPPHSSDQTQALDLGLFGIQKQIAQNLKNSKELSKFNNRLSKALQSLHQASTKKNIVSAFNSAGITRLPGESADSPIIIQVDRRKARAVRHFKRKDNENEVKIEGIDTNASFPVVKLTVCMYENDKAAKIKAKRKAAVENYHFTATNIYVAEAICSLACEEKPYVSSNKINKYLERYIEEIKQPKFIHKYTYDSLEIFQRLGIVNRKKNSYCLTERGAKKALEELDKYAQKKKEEKEEKQKIE